jgi:membrane fusion protein (multidrug efflux system)
MTHYLDTIFGSSLETNEHSSRIQIGGDAANISRYANGHIPVRKVLRYPRRNPYREIRKLRRVFELLRQEASAPSPSRADSHPPEIHSDSPPRTLAERQRRLLRGHPWRVVILLIIAGLLATASLRFWNYLQSYEWTDDAEIEGHLDPISTRINETVIRVYVENTYHVVKGQPLVDLDPRDYQVAVADATANLVQAQQGLQAAQQNYSLTVANLAGAVATNHEAQEDVARYGALFKESVISKELNDEIVRTGRVDAAAVDSDRAAARAAVTMIGQAEAAVKATQAELDQARLNLSYTHIVAPETGVVGDKTVQVGQRVQPGEQLLTIVPLNDIWVTADFRETQLRKMHRGQHVTIHVDTTGTAYKGYIEGLPGATGELFSLLPPENATGNYVKVVQRLPVRIRFYPGQDPHHRLRPGMSVEPTVWLNS